MASQLSSRIPSPTKSSARRPVAAPTADSAAVRTDLEVGNVQQTSRITGSTTDGKARPAQRAAGQAVPTRISQPQRSISVRGTLSNSAVPVNVRTSSQESGPKYLAHSRSISHSTRLAATGRDENTGMGARGLRRPTAALENQSSRLQHSRSRSVANNNASDPTRSQLATSRFQPGPTSKPEFSTFQHHYTPKKTSIPQTNTQIQTVSHDQYLDIVRLQGELLQLGLLAKCGRDNVRQSRVRLLNKTRAERGSIERDNEALLREQFVLACTRNSHELARWMDANLLGRDSSKEAVVTLAASIKNVTDLTSGSGRAARTLDDFEHWLKESCTTWDDKISGRHMEEPFVQALGPEWFENAAISIRSLSQCKSELEVLGGADISTGIGRMIDAHQNLVSLFLDELWLSEQLAKLVVQREHQHQRTGIAAILEGAEDVLSHSGDTKGAWE